MTRRATSDPDDVVSFFRGRMIYGFGALIVFFVMGAVVPGSRVVKVAVGLVVIAAIAVIAWGWGKRRRR